MRSCKARKPAADLPARRLHGFASKAGEPKRSEATSEPSAFQGVAVYSGQMCVGFLLPRGKAGHEACAGRSLGIFPDQRRAADAISQLGRRP